MPRYSVYTVLLIVFNLYTTVWSFQSRLARVVQPRQHPACHPHVNNNNIHDQLSRQLLISTSLLTAQQQDSNDFWSQQKMLMEELTTTADSSLAQEAQDKYDQQLQLLIAYSAYSIFFIFCSLWTFFDNPFVAFSYLFGSTLGLAYAYGLGKYVETIGGVATEAEAIRGAGVGQARFAFLILLFIFVGKFRSSGLMEVPTILGFFTYQLGSLLQGVRATND